MKYRWDDFVIDLDSFRLERSGVPLSLEPKAFNLLVMLIERPGHVFTKQEIFGRLWPNTAVTDHALTRVVAQLRRVLGDEARDGRYIETVPTRGYRWLPYVEAIAPAAPAPTTPAAALPSVEPAASGRVTRYAPHVIMLVVLLGITAWSQRETRTEATTPLRVSGATRDVAWPVQLTTHGGLDLHPAFSPQGDAVAFASDRTGTFELYVRAMEGSATEVALTRDGQHNVQPAWSPDGTQIAFHSHARGGLWVMPARGGVPRQIAAEGSHPAWSPDGQRIAFQSDEPSDVSPSAFGAQSGSTIRVVGVEGNTPRQLTARGQPLGGHASPSWTPDGRFIAFSVFDGARSNGVWIVSAETGETRQLLAAMRGHYELAFAPDGSSLYVAGGDPFITRIPFDKHSGAVSGERELMPVPGVAGVRGLTISGDGHRLGFAGLTTSSQLWVQPIAPDGSGRGDARALTTDTSRRNSLPAVSPDGARVAYVSTRGGETHKVWVVGIDGKAPEQVTTNESPDLQPYWFPDGRRVAFLSTRDNRMGLWSVDLETRREELIASLAAAETINGSALGNVAEPSLSRSLTKLALAVVTPPYANRRIFFSSIDTLALRPLSDPSHWAGYPAWSPDETRLAVELKDGSSTHAAVLNLSSGALRRLTNERGQTWVRSWSPDGTKIAAAVFRDGRWGLRWIDASSGVTGVITAPSGPNTYVRYPEWSPRGDLVVYERGELRGNVWMLRLNAPRPVQR